MWPMIPTSVERWIERLRPVMDRAQAAINRVAPVFAPAGRLWMRLEDRLPASAPILLVRAFSISIAAHLLCFTTIELGIRLGLLDQRMFPLLLLAERSRAKEDKDSADQKSQIPELVEIPVIFVSSDAAKAAKTAPKNTPYYSTHNSEAANTEAKIDSDKPKLTGKQEEVPATRTTVARVETVLVPVPEPPAPQPVKEEAQPLLRQNPTPPKPTEGPNPVNVAMVKPSETPESAKNSAVLKPEAALPRPRTLAAADAQAKLTQEAMKQDGGKKKISANEAMDVAAMPFGAYDERIVVAIEANWNELIYAQKLARSHIGKVVVTFRQHSDGHVSQLQTSLNDGDKIMEILCQRAIEGAAANNAFGPWPSDMRRLLGTDSRLVKFTFRYD